MPFNSQSSAYPSVRRSWSGMRFTAMRCASAEATSLCLTLSRRLRERKSGANSNVQHGSLGAGRVFAESQQAGMETFELRKIVRQRRETVLNRLE